MRNATLQTYVIENMMLKLRRIVIRRGAVVAENSVVQGGVVMGAGTVLCPLSILPRGVETKAGSVWQGSPGLDVTSEAADDEGRAMLLGTMEHNKQWAAAHGGRASWLGWWIGPSTLLPSSDSSQFPSTCSSLPLAFGCSNGTC